MAKAMQRLPLVESQDLAISHHRRKPIFLVLKQPLANLSGLPAVGVLRSEDGRFQG